MVTTVEAPEAMRILTKVNMYVGILVGAIVIMSTAIAVEQRYAKDSDLRELAVFTKMSFAELHLESTQERINRILAVPIKKRAAWQRTELLRLNSIKEAQLRRLTEKM